jgi:hypothetical protein
MHGPYIERDIFEIVQLGVTRYPRISNITAPNLRGGHKPFIVSYVGKGRPFFNRLSY